MRKSFIRTFSQGNDTGIETANIICSSIKQKTTVLFKDTMKPIDKTHTKKAQKLKNKKLRVLVPMNTGTRTHKSAKDYKRIKRWKAEDGE